MSVTTGPIWTQETDTLSAELVSDGRVLRLELTRSRDDKLGTTLTEFDAVDLYDALGEWLGLR